jgi:DNA-binding transcriptional ArsR family regulator
VDGAEHPAEPAPAGRWTQPRRPATDAEAKALASSLRLRILRMALEEPLTNREIAERLERHPASVLHHVRTLVDTGFLTPGEPRRGTRGSREIPYLATGKSWHLELEDDAAARRAMVEAFIDDSAAAGTADSRLVRMGLRLTDAERDELYERLHAVIEEYAQRPPTLAGRPWSLFLAVHPDPARPDPARPDPARPDPARPDPARPDPARPDPARPGA